MLVRIVRLEHNGRTVKVDIITITIITIIMSFSSLYYFPLGFVIRKV